MYRPKHADNEKNNKESPRIPLSGSVLDLSRSHSLLESLKSIGQEVLGVLNTAGHTDEVIEDTSSLALVLGDTSVGHAGRHLAKRLDTTQTLGQSEDLGVLAEEMSGFLAALDTEAQHTAAHAVAVLLDGNGTVGVRVNAGVVDGDDVGRSLEGLGDGGGVSGSLARTQVEGLETTVGEPAVEGGGDSADGVLEERKALLQAVGVEGGDTHQDILEIIHVSMMPVAREERCQELSLQSDR